MNFSTVVIQKYIVVIEQHGNTDVGQGMQLPWNAVTIGCSYHGKGKLGERMRVWTQYTVIRSDGLSNCWIHIFLTHKNKPVSFSLSPTNFSFVSIILTYPFLKQFVSCDNLNRLKILVCHDFFMLILSQPWMSIVPSGSFRIINILKYKIS